MIDRSVIFGVIVIVLVSYCCVPVICDAGGGYYTECTGDESHYDESSGSPLVNELKRRVRSLDIHPYYTSDAQLAKYIEDADFRVPVAQKMLQETAMWRKRNGLDSILNWTPSHILTSSFPFSLLGYSNEGNPIVSFPVGVWDYSRVLSSGFIKEDLVRYERCMLEHARNATIGLINPKTGEAVDQVIFIVDFGGISVKDLIVVRRHLAHLKLFQAIDRHYPHLTKKWYVVNLPNSMAGAWRIIRKFLSPRFVRQFSVYARGPETRTRGCGALLHSLPKSAIPASLQCQVPKPTCVYPFAPHESISYSSGPGNGAEYANEVATGPGTGPIPIPIQLPSFYGPPQVPAPAPVPAPALLLAPAPQLQYFQPIDSIVAASSNNETSVPAPTTKTLTTVTESSTSVSKSTSQKTSFI